MTYLIPLIIQKVSLMQKLCSHLEVGNSPCGTTEYIYYYIEDEMKDFYIKVM